MEIQIGKKRFSYPNVWFSADWHLGHFNIIKYCGRPFKTTDEMDNAIINNTNQVVGQDDALFFLGDFCSWRRYAEMSHEELAANYRKRLNCRNIYFIWGNHDKKLRGSHRFIDLWAGCYDLVQVKFEYNDIDGNDAFNEITLCHYSMQVWDRSHHGTYHLYGHSHGTLPDNINSRSFDVGVDCHNFWPLNIADVDLIISKKKWKAIDHHGVSH